MVQYVNTNLLYIVIVCNILEMHRFVHFFYMYKKFMFFFIDSPTANRNRIAFSHV